jgi:glycine cleavage system H lipoate-binding protein
MGSWVYGFAWSTGDFIFLGAFFTVVTIIGLTVLLSLRRTWRTIRSDQYGSVRWDLEFHDLPETARVCRHVFSGEFDRRTCQNGFDCRSCVTHGQLLEKLAAEPPAVALPVDTFGFNIPEDRLYHRGHAWVRKNEQGSFEIGLDDFASRLLGRPDGVALPKAGTHLHVNGNAWSIQKGDATVRILSPLDGIVESTADGSEGWYLKVKPLTPEIDTRHLLRRPEAAGWFAQEFERLQRVFADPKLGLTLPDGGAPVQDFTAAYPEKDWEAVYGEVFLEA